MNRPPLPLLRPRLPTADALLPYLQKIDANSHYTNFGPLNNTLLQRLIAWQTNRFGRPVFGAMTSSATLGIELLILDLKLPPKSKILVPSFTFVGTATAVLRCGHVPVVVDVDPATWLLTPQTLPEDLDLRQIGAVIPVAAFGMPQFSSAWKEWRSRTGIPVIIDAAGAFGAQATHENIPVVISLHATKCLSSGEGGLVLTEDEQQATRILSMTNFGIGLTESYGGTNAKMSEYHAAVGHAALDTWPIHSEMRASLYKNYQSCLRNACGDTIGFQKDTGLYAPTTMVVKFESSIIRDAAELSCTSDGIQTRRWYLPLIQQTALPGVCTPHPTPQACDLANQLLGLPFYLDMTQEDIDRVVIVIKNTITKAAHNPEE